MYNYIIYSDRIYKRRKIMKKNIGWMGGIMGAEGC